MTKVVNPKVKDLLDLRDRKFENVVVPIMYTPLDSSCTNKVVEVKYLFF